MRCVLKQTIHYAKIIHILGWLLLFEAAYMVLPMLVDLYYGERDDLFSFLFAFLITAVSAAIMMACTRSKQSDSVMNRRDGLLLTAIVWVVLSFFGMLPYMLSGVLTSVPDAFFETMSGYTTTGATMLRNVEQSTHGILLWRALTQWMGGMGIILFTLAVLPMLNDKVGVAMFNSEVPGITHERMEPRVSQTAKWLWSLYLLLTLILFVLLVLGPMNWFDALCHTLSTVSTGGFSTKNAGLHYWHSYYADVCIMIFMFIGGMNFVLIYGVSRGRFKLLKKNDVFKWYCGIILLASVIIILRMWSMDFCNDWSDRILYATFDVISGVTSSGFSTIDYESSGEFIAMIIFLCMFFGGCAGGTSGGAKIDRLVVLLKNTKNEFYRVLHVNAVTTVRIDGKSMPHDVVARVIAFLAIYMIVMVGGALLLSLMGYSIFDSLFNSLSCLSNVGYGYGITGDKMGSTFYYLSNPAKWLLSFEMLVGRLELFTVLILFSKGFWIKD